jgi:integrase
MKCTPQIDKGKMFFLVSAGTEKIGDKYIPIRFRYFPDPPIHVKVGEAVGRWNKKDKKIRGTSREVLLQNEIIRQHRIRIEDLWISMVKETGGRKPNWEMFKARVKGEDYIPPETFTLIDLIQLVRRERKRDLAQTTLRYYLYTVDLLKKFHKEAKYDLHLKNINFAFYRSFTGWMIQKNTLSNPTINNVISKIKASLEWGYTNDASDPQAEIIRESIDINVLRRFKPLHGDNKEPLFPSIQEVASLLQMDRSSLADVQAVELDRYLFCCFTGLRHSDTLKLTVRDIHVFETESGEMPVLRYRQQKGKRVNTTDVPLNSVAMDIINRNRGEEKIFPYRSVSATNIALHHVFESSKLFEGTVEEVSWIGTKEKRVSTPRHMALSFHSSRHFFGTRGAALGLSEKDRQSLMGHSSPKMTQHYTHIADKVGMLENASKALEWPIMKVS